MERSRVWGVLSALNLAYQKVVPAGAVKALVNHPGYHRHGGPVVYAKSCDLIGTSLMELQEKE
jgi:hypothetical protein